eukprot:TRINITY_DN51708_c0_g2_i1.p1 TRINITY_DN51708_c0_g2~~TRINITY_DN51708_c0_g2_i1.p1  ORF type:complete len:156 (+),score=7.70 TRINITY_DN51708_c0_g2_i1:88-555(+)
MVQSFSAKSPLVVVVIVAIAFCWLPLFGAIGFSPGKDKSGLWNAQTRAIPYHRASTTPASCIEGGSPVIRAEKDWTTIPEYARNPMAPSPSTYGTTPSASLIAFSDYWHGTTNKDYSAPQASTTMPEYARNPMAPNQAQVRLAQCQQTYPDFSIM